MLNNIVTKVTITELQKYSMNIRCPNLTFRFNLIKKTLFSNVERNNEK